MVGGGAGWFNRGGDVETCPRQTRGNKEKSPQRSISTTHAMIGARSAEQDGTRKGMESVCGCSCKRRGKTMLKKNSKNFIMA